MKSSTALLSSSLFIYRLKFVISLPASHYLVECSSSGENDVRVVHLNGSLAEPHQIGSDPDGPACDLRGQTIMLGLSAGCGLCSRKILLTVHLAARCVRREWVVAT